MDYLQWQSTLSAEDVFSGSQTFIYPEFLVDGSMVYLTSLTDDKNRSALVRLDGQREQVITPPPHHLQTQISEYGGKPFWLNEDCLIFANRDDQRLYRQALEPLLDGRTSQPHAISCVGDDEIWRYADVHILQSGDILFIAEQQNTIDHSEKSFIGFLPIGSQKHEVDVNKNPAIKPIVLVEGADFYSNLVIDEDNGRLAWVQWNHPNMPWDNVDLRIANIDLCSTQLTIGEVENIDLSDISQGQKSICQLLFAGNGKLFFSADFSGQLQNSLQNYWQVYCLCPVTKKIVQVTSAVAEFGYPHWVYGDQRIIQLGDDTIVTIESSPDGDTLVAIDLNDLSTAKVFTEQSTIQHLSSDCSGRCVFVSLSKVAAPKILSLNLSQPSTTVVLKEDTSNNQVREATFKVSSAESISYPTRDGADAHGFFYAPNNHEYEAKTSKSSKPPLLVMVHGGPTARAYGHFDLQKQFWTSRGFALFDVNHRGSSGYGRLFRDSLYGNWGEIDASDIIDGIDYLIEQNLVDANRVCIRGKSAGGYAVLRALTEYPDRFKAGANYYGIGNLVTLAESTHKFEKYYTDKLIGEKFVSAESVSENSRFFQRSPINKIKQLNSAMIVFQGLLDKVVPPEVAQELVDVLKSQKQQYSYTEYPDEGHGFRQATNNVDAWTRELSFYKEVLAY